MPQNDLQDRVRALNDRYRHHSAISVLEHALRDPQAGTLALVSSFGAESVVLLHMVSVTRRAHAGDLHRHEMLFAETLVYQQELAERLACAMCGSSARRTRDLTRRTPTAPCISATPMPAAPCARRCPCNARLRGSTAGSPGASAIRRACDHARLLRDRGGHAPDQGQSARALDARRPADLYGGKPPAPASAGRQGLSVDRLHPLHHAGRPGEDPRSGRWRGQDKTECGIHFVNGKLVRKGVSA